jgi:hypothetical protein
LWNAQSNLTIQNNIWYNPGNYGIIRYWSSATACVIDHNMVYGAVGLISDSSGCSVGANQIGTDPMFVNASLTLRLSPPAAIARIDAGVITPGITRDIEGLPVPKAAADLGAYEYPNDPDLPAIPASRSR